MRDVAREPLGLGLRLRAKGMGPGGSETSFYVGYPRDLNFQGCVMFLVLITVARNDGALTVQSGQWVQRVPRTSESDQFRIHGFDNCLVPTPNGGVAMQPSCFCGVRGVRTETTAALLDTCRWLTT